jgi:uncharacterized protein
MIMRLDTYYNIREPHARYPHLLIAPPGPGKGVRAKYNLQEHSLLCCLSGRYISFTDWTQMEEPDRGIQVDADKFLIPEFPFHVFKHSCIPNCGINTELQLITIRHVHAGEELCWDYSTSLFGSRMEQACTCGQPGCRGTISDFNQLPRSLQLSYFKKGIVLPYIKNYMKAIS